jgi:hypothetical protein
MAEQAKVDQVKSHYAAIKNGTAACYGAESIVRRQRTSARSQPKAEMVKVEPTKKHWTIVDNSKRKCKWKTYMDEEDRLEIDEDRLDTMNAETRWADQ